MRVGLVPLLLLLSAGAGLNAADLSDWRHQAARGGAVSIAVMDCETGAWVHREGATQALSMASLAKLFVSAAALVELGPEHVFHTRVVATGPIEDGTVPALAVLPSGSPCLDEHFTDRQPDRLFAGWAETIHRAGVRRVAGDLVIDHGLFEGPIRPATYPDDHLNAQRWYSAPASAFAFNDNCIEVRVVPTAPGKRARIEVRPRSPRIAVVNKTRTVRSNPSNGIVVSRAHRANTITVNGRYTKTTTWFPLAIHEQPDLLAGDHLAAALADRGVAIEGRVRLGGVIAVGPELVDHQDRLVPALAILNQRSQNFYGEQLVRVLGARLRDEGSIAAGTTATLEVLREELALDLTSVDLLDGSGLSYGNRASAADVCLLLRAMDRHPHAAIYRQSLKEKGHRGVTARVKTGSLSIARCLAGYIPAPEGGRYAFAILLNRAEAGSIGWANQLRDKAFQQMCERLGKP